jgi:predicted AlkP superfamily phosphohydrolase/phosphomutase
LSRLLVIGWDGATWSVADPLCKAGRLPTLSALRAGGAEGVLETVPNMNSAPAWSTIATGLDPGRHGIFYFDEPVPGTYRRTVVNATRRTGATLWRLASDAGKRVIVVNVPISYRAENVNGFMVAGLDTPSKSLPGFTYPSDLPGRYPKLFDRYAIEVGAPSLMLAGRVQEAKDKLLDCVEGWAGVTERLMDEDWDLVFVVFTSSDTAQHFFWTDAGRQTIERVYEAQDEATARLVEKARAADPSTNVLIVADHGGATNTRGPEFMPVWLEDQGLQARTTPRLTSRSMAWGFHQINRRLSREQKLRLAQRFPRMREKAEAEARTVSMDWSRTRAYADGKRDEVLVNLAGREPSGLVAQAEYEGFVRDLAGKIREIKEAGTGRPVVEDVLIRSTAYHGPYIERAPDLTVRWVIDGRAFQGFEARTARGRERMAEVAAKPPFQPGGHHPHGIVVANGPNIAPGSVGGGLTDVAPTVLALLGVPIPEGLDGKPLDMLKDVDALTGGDADAAAAPVADETTGYTPEEEEAVRKRLEDLGYL